MTQTTPKYIVQPDGKGGFVCTETAKNITFPVLGDHLYHAAEIVYNISGVRSCDIRVITKPKEPAP